MTTPTGTTSHAAAIHRAKEINSKLNQIAESGGMDPELVALEAVVAAFESLTPAERTRAVEYLRSRYGQPEPY